MKLILGLGHFDNEKSLIRHNIGYQVFDWFCQKYEIKFNPQPRDLLTYQEVDVLNKKVCLLKLQTKSYKIGSILKMVMENLKIEPKDLIVIQDDYDMRFGQIKLSRSGNSITHTAMNSIVDALHTSEFSKIRIGVGQTKTRNGRKALLSEYSDKEFKKLPKVYEEAVNIIEEVIKGLK